MRLCVERDVRPVVERTLPLAEAREAFAALAGRRRLRQARVRPLMARSATIRMPIRWRDIDALGHVNQSVYHEFLEEGRGALFEPLIEAAGGFEFVLARIELDYRREVRPRGPGGRGRSAAWRRSGGRA